MIAVWPLIARAFTEDESPYHTSATLDVALRGSVGVVEAPTSPVERVSVPIAVNPPSDVQRLVEAEFGEGHIMVRIIAAESQFVPTAQNPRSTAAGLGQILLGTWNSYGCTGNRYDAVDNLRCTKKIYEAEGTRPWISSSYAW